MGLGLGLTYIWVFGYLGLGLGLGLDPRPKPKTTRDPIQNVCLVGTCNNKKSRSLESTTSDESPAKGNPSEALSNAFNSANFTIADQAYASRKSAATIQPPSFPPPHPPPKPAPPAPTTSGLPSPATHNNLIVQSLESGSPSLVSLKVENKTVVERLVNNYGFDRVKVACALMIANNDVKAALDILQKYRNIT